MSEIDERLVEIQGRLDRDAFHRADEDICCLLDSVKQLFHHAGKDTQYLLELVEQLRQVRGNWSPDYKRQVLYELEAAEAEAAELRKRLAALEFAYGSLRASANILEQQLADVTALVPEAEWLEMVAMLLEGVEVTFCDQCPFEVKGPCKLQCTDTEKPRALADRIRAWRGDGDGGEGREEGDKS